MLSNNMTSYHRSYFGTQNLDIFYHECSTPWKQYHFTLFGLCTAQQNVTKPSAACISFLEFRLQGFRGHNTVQLKGAKGHEEDKHKAFTVGESGAPTPRLLAAPHLQ